MRVLVALCAVLILSACGNSESSAPEPVKATHPASAKPSHISWDDAMIACGKYAASHGGDGSYDALNSTQTRRDWGYDVLLHYSGSKQALCEVDNSGKVINWMPS